MPASRFTARLPPLFSANLTEVTKDKLLKNAQQLRESADLLEKDQSEIMSSDTGFISTYAIKSAPVRDPANINNITVIPKNESLYKNVVIVEERAVNAKESEREKKIKSLYEDIDELKVEAVDSYVRTVIETQKATARTSLVKTLRELLKADVTSDTVSEAVASLFYYRETVRSLEQDEGDSYFRNLASVIEVNLFII